MEFASRKFSSSLRAFAFASRQRLRPMSRRAGSSRTVHAILNLELSASHFDVKRAYLSLAMRIHPDKVAPHEYQRAHEQFADLQAAWDRYETERPRNFRRRCKVGDDEDPLRQLFGVGCSWTDTEAERLERISVQEQAARGLTFRSRLTARGEQKEG